MSRTGYALMSLTAAIPGALLFVLLVWAFLQHAGSMPGMLAVVAGITLLIAAMLTVTPVGILLFGGPKAAKSRGEAAAAAPKGAKSKTQPERDESFVADDEEDAEQVDDLDEDDWNEGDSAVDFDSADYATGDEFEFDDTITGESEADFDFDDRPKR